MTEHHPREIWGFFKMEIQFIHESKTPLSTSFGIFAVTYSVANFLWVYC